MGVYFDLAQSHADEQKMTLHLIRQLLIALKQLVMVVSGERTLGIFR